MKALRGAAALQVAAVVTSTDWSSNGNPHPLACKALVRVPQATSVGGGPRSRAEALGQVGSEGGCAGPVLKAGPSEAQRDGARGSWAPALSPKGTRRFTQIRR